jgi:hypothetical protein
MTGGMLRPLATQKQKDIKEHHPAETGSKGSH